MKNHVSACQLIQEHCGSYRITDGPQDIVAKKQHVTFKLDSIINIIFSTPHQESKMVIITYMTSMFVCNFIYYLEG